jgi:hypothetical protein
MIDYNIIRKLTENINKNRAKLAKETDFKKKQKLRYKIEIDGLKIKIEQLN